MEFTWSHFAKDHDRSEWQQHGSDHPLQQDTQDRDHYPSLEGS